MVKISDISLWRDKIIKTQYCAGDSILVPYHVSGIIGPGNTFHAELSDSNGSFDSVYYTIGKITRQGNGIIHCKLPANLPYSSRYNIHVYSDTPNVTSYYNPQTIEIYPNPIVKIAYDSPVCKSSLDTLHASGATSYLWLPSTALSDNKSANPVFKADTTRTYSIIAKNPGGCMDTTKFSITVGPELKLSILSPTKDTIVCSGSAVKLRAEAKGGYGLPYFYTWNKGLGNGDTLTIHPTFNDVYRVSTTGGCKATASVQIKVYAPLKVSAGKDQGICPGHSNHLHASGNGGDSSMYTFNWDNGLGTGADKIISTTNTKTYKVVLSENLCNLKPDSALITVYRTNPMKLFLPADTNLCYGQSVFARANGGDSLRYIYSWDTGGVVIPNWATARVAPTKSETYRCILTDSCSLHSDTAFVKVKVSPPLKLVMPKDTTICQGTSVTLSAHIFGGNGDTASYKYTWDTSGSIIAKTKNIITYPPYTTRFRCIVNDGCSSPDTGFVNVFIHPLYLSLKDTSVCKGEKVTLKIVGHGGDSNYIYTWRPGNFHADSVTLIADSSIHFDILLDDKCSIVGHTIFGYEAYLNFTVLPTPESNMKISPTSIEIGTGDIQFNALNTDADSFLWLFGDGIDGKGIKQTHTYQTDGTFSPRLISTNKYGCKDTAQGEVIILPQLQVYFPNVFTPDGDSLNETWMPVGIGISRINITIYDRWGGHVFKSESLTKGWNGNILDSNDLALPGVYPYIVNFWDFNNKKFIKTGTIHLLNAARY